MEEVQTALQATPIDKLGLSERVVKALRRARVSRIGKLLARMEKGEESLISIKGIGPASLEQIKSVLDQAPLEILGLSTRVHNCLKGAETTTLGQLLQRMENGKMALLSIHNFGPKSLQQLKKAIPSFLDHSRESPQKEDVGSTLKLSRWLPLPKRLALRPAFTAVIVLMAAIVALAIMSTEVQAVADNSSTFWFYDDTTPLTYMMYQSQPSGIAQSKRSWLRFYSDTFEDNQEIYAGTATVYIYATNTAGVSKDVVVILYVDRNGSEVATLGNGSVTVPKKVDIPTLYTTSFNHSAFDFQEGDRLELEFAPPGAVTVYWDGEYNASRLEVGIIVPEGALALLALAPLIPLLVGWFKRSGRMAALRVRPRR